MASKVPISLYFVIIFLIILEIVLLMPNKVDISETLRGEEPKVFYEADLHIEGFKLVETRSPTMFWNLNAERALVFREFDLGVLSKIKGELEEKKEKHHLTVIGNQGFFFITDKTLLLREDVEAKTEEGYRITASYIWVDSQKQRLKTAAPIKFIGPDPISPMLSISGQGFVSKLEEQQHEILQNVVAERFYENEPPLMISASRGTVDTGRKIAEFHGKVLMEKGGLKIASDNFQVKYLETREVDWASATGNVRLWEGGWEGECEEAVLTNRNKFVELKGGVVMRRGNDIVSSEMVTLDRDNKKIIVKKIDAELEVPEEL